MKKHEYVPIPGFEFNQFTFTTPCQDSVLLVTYACTAGYAAGRSARVLAEYRDGLLKVSGGTLEHSEPIQLSDYPGLEYTVVLPKSTRNPQGIVDQARVYLVDGRVYGLDFVARPGMADAPEVNQFFDSCQVTPKAS